MIYIGFIKKGRVVMKCVVINGSPRQVNTWAMVKQAESAMLSLGDVDFDEIHLKKLNIPFCNGCTNCVINGEDKCPHFDIIREIAYKLENADCIILSSPVYVNGPTGLIKNLLDHFAYYYHRPRLFDKKALVLVSTQGSGRKDVADFLEMTLHNFGVNRVYKVPMAFYGREKLDESMIETINKKARDFYNDVKSGKLKCPKRSQVTQYTLWRAMANNGAIKKDQKFWMEHDLINHDYEPHTDLSILKRLYAKLLYSFFNHVVFK